LIDLAEQRRQRHLQTVLFHYKLLQNFLPKNKTLLGRRTRRRATVSPQETACQKMQFFFFFGLQGNQPLDFKLTQPLEDSSFKMLKQASFTPTPPIRNF